jgi:hypothetical protein
MREARSDLDSAIADCHAARAVPGEDAHDQLGEDLERLAKLAGPTTSAYDVVLDVLVVDDDEDARFAAAALLRGRLLRALRAVRAC